MQTILYNISQVIGVAIIHSMWQGLLIYLVLRVLLSVTPRLSSAAKHNIALIALLSVTAWFIYTLANEISIYQWVALKPEEPGILPAILDLPIHGKHINTYSARYYYTIEGLLPYITLIYLAGLLFNTGKMVWARKKITSIRQNMSIDVQLQLRVDKFVKLLDVRGKVQFGLSKLIDGPCMMGYFKPVILLPFTLSAYLPADEIEIIILHELAHIKRNDYLINLGQQSMAVLLFFNPFAQLINRTINKERENSCDDIVIEATQKPLVYAHALLKLEQTRQHEWELALAATGKKYHLLNRIERIMKTKKPIGNTRHILLAIALLAASITGLAWLNPTIANGKVSINKIKPVILSDLLTDTIKKAAAARKTAATKRTGKKHTTTIYSNGKTYTYNNNLHDAQLDKLSAEVSKYGDELSKYYDSPQWKKYQEDIEQQSKKIEDYYSSPQWKELTEKQEKLSGDFDKNWGETKETTEWSDQMSKQGKVIETYYNSPEFKKLNEQLETKYGIPHNRHQWSDMDRRDENYRKYDDELKSHTPANVNQAQVEIKRLGEKMRNHWHSPEYEKQRDEMRLLSDSIRQMSNNAEIKDIKNKMKDMNAQMRAYQNNPEMKKLQADMRTEGAKMRSYQNSAEMKKIKENMRLAQAKMRAYMNSPEFKKRMNEWKKYSYQNDWNWDNRDDEKSEKPEVREKSEAPEKQEKADTTGNN